MLAMAQRRTTIDRLTNPKENGLVVEKRRGHGSPSHRKNFFPSSPHGKPMKRDEKDLDRSIISETTRQICSRRSSFEKEWRCRANSLLALPNVSLNLSNPATRHPNFHSGFQRKKRIASLSFSSCRWSLCRSDLCRILRHRCPIDFFFRFFVEGKTKR